MSSPPVDDNGVEEASASLAGLSLNPTGDTSGTTARISNLHLPGMTLRYRTNAPGLVDLTQLMSDDFEPLYISSDDYELALDYVTEGEPAKLARILMLGIFRPVALMRCSFGGGRTRGRHAVTGSRPTVGLDRNARDAIIQFVLDAIPGSDVNSIKTAMRNELSVCRSLQEHEATGSDDGAATRAGGAAARSEGEAGTGDGGQVARESGDAAARAEEDEEPRGNGGEAAKGDGSEVARGDGDNTAKEDGGEVARGDGDKTDKVDGGEAARESRGAARGGGGEAARRGEGETARDGGGETVTGGRVETARGGGVEAARGGGGEVARGGGSGAARGGKSKQARRSKGETGGSRDRDQTPQ